MSPRNNLKFLETELVREGRFERIEAWAAEQMGVRGDQLGPAEIRERLPRQMGLRYNAKASQSPHGGRFDFHLRHLADTEVIERLARADRFVERTSCERRPARTSGAPQHSDSRQAANQKAASSS